MKKILLFTIIVAALISCSKEDDIPEEIKRSITVAIKSHNNKSEIYNNEKLTFSADVEALNTTVSQVDFYLGTELIGTVFSKPYTIDKTLVDYEPGYYKLKVIAVSSDAFQNQSEINLLLKIRFKDNFKGGIVFMVDEKGEHGLIMAPNDLSGGVLGKYKYGAYNGDYGATSMDDGEYNTNKFIGEPDFNYAAHACLDYVNEGFDDWYLPALNEMNIFIDNKDLLGIEDRQFEVYWTSTEANTTGAYSVCFGGTVGQPDDKQNYRKVRPIRKF